MSKVVHFEEVWVAAEKIAAKQTETDMECIGKVSSAINEIKDIYRASLNSKDIALVQGIKAKALGRLLMSVAALSNKENIDVYQAMKDQIDVSEMRDKVVF